MKISVLIQGLQELLAKHGEHKVSYVHGTYDGGAYVTLVDDVGWSKDFLINKPAEMPQSSTLEQHDD